MTQTTVHPLLRLTFQLRIRFNRLGVFSKICRNSFVSSEKRKKGKVRMICEAVRLLPGLIDCYRSSQPLPSSSSSVTVGSTYSHQCLLSVETGISQLDHLQARWMHTQATMGGLYCRQKVVRCRLHTASGSRGRITHRTQEDKRRHHQWWTRDT